MSRYPPSRQAHKPTSGLLWGTHGHSKQRVENSPERPPVSSGSPAPCSNPCAKSLCLSRVYGRQVVPKKFFIDKPCFRDQLDRTVQEFPHSFIGEAQSILRHPHVKNYDLSSRRLRFKRIDWEVRPSQQTDDMAILVLQFIPVIRRKDDVVAKHSDRRSIKSLAQI